VSGVTKLAREIKDRAGHIILVTESGQAIEPSLELLVPSSARNGKPFAEPDLPAKIKSELTAASVATKRDDGAAQPRDMSDDDPRVRIRRLRAMIWINQAALPWL